MHVSGINVFTWDASSQNVDSSLVSLNLKGSNGKPLNISGLSEDIEISIPRTDTSSPKPEGTYFTKDTNLTMQFHTFPINEEGLSIQLEIHPVNYTDTFKAFAKKGSRPSRSNYDMIMTIPDFSSCHLNESVGYVNCSYDPYMMFIPSESLEVGAVYFVGILYEGADDSQERVRDRQRRDCLSGGRMKRSCIKYKDPPPTPKPEGFVTVKPLFDALNSHNYTLKRNSVGCRYWDPVVHRWSTKGCKVSVFISIVNNSVLPLERYVSYRPVLRGDTRDHCLQVTFIQYCFAN